MDPGAAIGNGHMGAMCYGGSGGRFDLSESTCWSGCAQSKPFKEGAAQAMSQAREKLMEGRYDEADALLQNCVGVKGNYGTQVPMGRLVVCVEAQETGCKRTLELEDGLALDELAFSDQRVCRESFLSNPDKVMAVRLWSEEKAPMPGYASGWRAGASPASPAGTKRAAP